MGLFDGYVDPQSFADRGGLLGRLLSLRPDLAQDEAGADQPAATLQAPALAPLSWPSSAFWPNAQVGGQTSTSLQPQPASDPHSQYEALRPALGDYHAMLATVHPEVSQSLIAQAAQASPQGQGNTIRPSWTDNIVPGWLSRNTTALAGTCATTADLYAGDPRLVEGRGNLPATISEIHVGRFWR